MKPISNPLNCSVAFETFDLAGSDGNAELPAGNSQPRPSSLLAGDTELGFAGGASDYQRRSSFDVSQARQLPLIDSFRKALEPRLIRRKESASKKRGNRWLSCFSNKAPLCASGAVAQGSLPGGALSLEENSGRCEQDEQGSEVERLTPITSFCLGDFGALEGAKHCILGSKTKIRYFSDEKALAISDGGEGSSGAGIVIADYGSIKGVGLDYIYTVGLTGCAAVAIVGNAGSQKNLFFAHCRMWSSAEDEMMDKAAKFVAGHDSVEVFLAIDTAYSRTGVRSFADLANVAEDLIGGHLGVPVARPSVILVAGYIGEAAFSLGDGKLLRLGDDSKELIGSVVGAAYSHRKLHSNSVMAAAADNFIVQIDQLRAKKSQEYLIRHPASTAAFKAALLKRLRAVVLCRDLHGARLIAEDYEQVLRPRESRFGRRRVGKLINKVVAWLFALESNIEPVACGQQLSAIRPRLTAGIVDWAESDSVDSILMDILQ